MPDDLHYLHRAARLAWRGFGGAEPNPMVGCIIVGADGQVAGAGYHRRCGQAHAEINALRAAGPRARGSTAYVTLEPCAHTGRTEPCADALVEAGVTRVVIARRDPHGAASGGAERLRQAGITVDLVEDAEAGAPTEPFVHRLRTGLPWVIAKWAQTIDGRVATRDGSSQWISGPRSRRLVHRQRGRVDAVLTGIGTILADDPQLTARDTRRLRRIARRIVIDPHLQTPRDARVVASAAQTPTTIVTAEDCVAEAGPLTALGAEVVGFPVGGGRFDLAALLGMLQQRHEISTVWIESGPGLLGGLFRARLVNECWVFIAGLVAGDDQAVPAVRSLEFDSLSTPPRLKLIGAHRRDNDVLLRYVAGMGSDGV